ncbi:hypothetical protein ACIBCT_23720 [Streptosporangium sp. NPDC050855]|uniref:hypothetical protein n=1 Tax=Streptosporangium sp. NPDC050855 TaxID=3366194 RepID=UPI0037891777
MADARSTATGKARSAVRAVRAVYVVYVVHVVHVVHVVPAGPPPARAGLAGRTPPVRDGSQAVPWRAPVFRRHRCHVRPPGLAVKGTV